MLRVTTAARGWADPSRFVVVLSRLRPFSCLATTDFVFTFDCFNSGLPPLAIAFDQETAAITMARVAAHRAQLENPFDVVSINYYYDYYDYYYDYYNYCYYFTHFLHHIRIDALVRSHAHQTHHEICRLPQRRRVIVPTATVVCALSAISLSFAPLAVFADV